MPARESGAGCPLLLPTSYLVRTQASLLPVCAAHGRRYAHCRFGRSELARETGAGAPSAFYSALGSPLRSTEDAPRITALPEPHDSFTVGKTDAGLPGGVYC